MPVETWLIFILSFMIVGSIAALEIKDLLSSIIAIGVVGLGVSVSFLFLQAPDLAIVQFLFEIFALIILIRAYLRGAYHVKEPSKSHQILIAVSILVLAVVFVLSIQVFKALPEFGQPLMETSRYYLQNAANETGAANIVTSIILDYRAYDTLGEVTVLFTAILGALMILHLKSPRQTTEGGDEA